MLNLLTAFTNFTAYYPILTALSFNDNVTAACVIVVACLSAISHLFESHIHNMWGFGCPSSISYLLDRLGVAGVIVIMSRVIQLWASSNIKSGIITDNIPRALLLFLSVVCNIISERDEGFMYYLPLHCMWHMSIFLLLNSFLKSIYSTSS